MSTLPTDPDAIAVMIREEVRAAGIPAAPSEVFAAMHAGIDGVAERVADQFYLCMSEYPDAEFDLLDNALAAALGLIDAAVKGCLDAYNAAEPELLDQLSAMAERAFIYRLNALSVAIPTGGSA